MVEAVEPGFYWLFEPGRPRRDPNPFIAYLRDDYWEFPGTDWTVDIDDKEDDGTLIMARFKVLGKAGPPPEWAAVSEDEPEEDRDAYHF